MERTSGHITPNSVDQPLRRFALLGRLRFFATSEVLCCSRLASGLSRYAPIS